MTNKKIGILLVDVPEPSLGFGNKVTKMGNLIKAEWLAVLRRV